MTSVQQKDPNVSQDSQIGIDVKNSYINDTKNASMNDSMMDPYKRHKIQKRILHEGKWLLVTEEPLDEQIRKHREELILGDEVVKKLRAQREKLDVQVKEICGLVQEKVKESKNDERKKIKKTLEFIQNPNLRQYDQLPQKLTSEEVVQRIKELDLEEKNGKKQEQMLNKELAKAKYEHEDNNILDQISTIEDKIKKVDQDSITTANDIKNMEKAQKNNEKKIQSVQSDHDDAYKINRLTQDVQQQKTKLKNYEDKKKKEEEQYQVYEKLIAEMNAKYVENCEKAKLKPIPLDQKYHDIQVEKKKADPKDSKAIDPKAPKNQDPKASKPQDPIAKPQDPKPKPQDPKDAKPNDPNAKPLNPKPQEPQANDSKEPKPSSQQKKLLVKDIRKEQDNFDSLPITLVNYIRLDQNFNKLLEQKKHQKKNFNKEIRILQDRQSEIQFEISSTQQYTREKEKEKDLANSRFSDLKKLVKHNELEAIVAPQQKTILEKKKDELKKNEAHLLLHRKTDPKNPFSERNYKFSKKSSQKQFDQSIEEEPTPLDMILDCNFRLSSRQLFGLQPDKDTQICDDVNVVGTLSSEHRIRKILFYHSIQHGLIYGFQSEYVRQDKKSTVAGQWQINEDMKKSPDSIQEILEINTDDWITNITGELSNGFINYMQVQTKRGKHVSLGKQLGTHLATEFHFKRSKGEIPITIFGGFNAQGNDNKSLALSCFGLECAQKMKIEEKNILEAEIKQKKDQKQKDINEKLLNESQLLQPIMEVEKPKEHDKVIEKPDKVIEKPKEEKGKDEKSKQEQSKDDKPKQQKK